jgi:hypothetical protein
MDKYLEHQIDNITYPAKLGAPIRRVLAASLHEIGRAYEEARTKLSTDHQYRTKQVLIADLTDEQQVLIAEYTSARVIFNNLERRMRDEVGTTTVTDDPTFIHVSMTDAEVNAAQAAYGRQHDALKAIRDERLKDLKAVIVRIAAAQVKVVKSKIPTALVEELEAIIPTRKQLTAGTEEV